jgi:hypothetical protein
MALPVYASPMQKDLVLYFPNYLWISILFLGLSNHGDNSTFV